MIRVVKDPEERREQLLDVAEKLIIKKGYEHTTVSDIVKKAKVAQGTKVTSISIPTSTKKNGHMPRAICSIESPLIDDPTKRE